MKVYEYTHKDWGRAFIRISKALHEFSTDVTWTNLEDSDVAIVHIVGEGEIEPVQKVLDLGKKVVMLHECYYTTGYNKWEELWEKVDLIASFHDLKSYANNKNLNFYSFPLGADEKSFIGLGYSNRPIKVFATGHVKETECLDEIHQACVLTNNTMFHTGENFKYDSHYMFLNYLPEYEFIKALNMTEYVPCLRLIEGFEMMGVEGLFCGARPIVLDLPTYRWYKDFGIFINPNKDITTQLVDILNSDFIPVSRDERRAAIERFSWRIIIKDLFDKIREVV